MEIITLAIDFILHVDKHLEAFVTNYGWWVYALLFLIIFVETGVVVMPFLPGDSLLFVVGAMCGVGLMNYPLTVGLLFAAAVLGNSATLWGVFGFAALLLGAYVGLLVMIARSVRPRTAQIAYLNAPITPQFVAQRAVNS